MADSLEYYTSLGAYYSKGRKNDNEQLEYVGKRDFCWSRRLIATNKCLNYSLSILLLYEYLYDV